jgi:acetyltransferase-like isoleucine patch superfamily enzyme
MVRGWMLTTVGAASSAAAIGVRAARRVASPLARLWRLTSLKARVDGDVPVTTQFDGAVETAGRVRLVLGEHCRFGRRVFLETCDGGVIRMGANVRVNAGAFIVSYAEVSIGDDAMIAEYVGIRDADHGMAPDRPIRVQPHAAKPVRIGNDVWIGRGSVVLKGVTIGDGAVVAANSVVTHDVPPMTIVAGTPARVLRRRDAPARREAAPGGGVSAAGARG